MSDMTSSFKSKTEKFVQDIQSDLRKTSKPILKQSTGDEIIIDGNKPRTYREETRDVQYGNQPEIINLHLFCKYFFINH